MEFLKLELQVVVGCLGRVLEPNWGPLQELQFSRLCGPSSGPQHCTACSSLAARRASGPLSRLSLSFHPWGAGITAADYGVQFFVWVQGLSLSSLGLHSERIYPQNLGTSAQLCFHGKALQLSWEGTPSLAGTWQAFFGMSRNCWGRRVLRTG